MDIDLIYLLLFAFIAGYIDSIVGGGGLIQLPAYLIFAPHLPIITVLGTNKFSALMGTLVSTYRYLQSAKVIWGAVFPALISCMVFSYVGAKLVTYLNTDYLRIIILFLLIAVALYTFFKKNMGLSHDPRHTGRTETILSILTGSVLGFYDGFFGPGTGSFLILAYVTLFRFDFINASVSAKIINCGTNFAALIFFVYGGHINYPLALSAGVCNMAGSYLGAHTAIKKGSGFVRVFFLLIVSALIAKFSYDIF